MNKVKIGVIGSGFQADIHCASCRILGEDGEVVAVASPTLGRAQALADRHGIPGAYHDYRQMLAEPEIEMVTIAAPNHLHAEMVRHAAEAGKHVVCEKPLCLTLEEADAMIDICRAKGVLLLYGEELLFTPKYLKAKSMADEGAFGRIHLVKQSERHSGPHSPWFRDLRQAGGGVFMDMGCHGIAFCYWFLGRSPVATVYCQMNAQAAQGPEALEDNSLCILEFENGAIGLVENSWTRTGGMDDRIEVYGSRGLTLADLHMGNALPTYQRDRLRLCRREGARHQGLELSGLRRALQLRHASGVAPLCPLRARQGGADHDGRGRPRRAGGAARRLCLGRGRPQGRAAVPAEECPASRRSLARRAPQGRGRRPVSLAALGLDLGLSGARAAVVNEAGELLGSGRAAGKPWQGAPDIAERDPEEWYEEILAAGRMALGQAGDNAIAAIGIGALGPCPILLDAELKALAPAPLFSLDQRAEATRQQLIAAHGLSSEALGPDHALPKLFWWREHEPALIGRAKCVVDATGFLVARLTGRPAMDPITAEDYAAPGIASPVPLPPSARALSVAGSLLPGVAKRLGLPSGIPVAVGSYDSYVDIWGSGARKPGEGCIVLGSTLILGRLVAGPVEAPGLRCQPAIGEGRFLGGWTSAAGSLLDWSRELLGDGANDPASVASLMPGAGGLLVLPYFAGERAPVWDPAARGAILGATLATTREELARAMIDGVALSALDIAARLPDAGDAGQAWRLCRRRRAQRRAGPGSRGRPRPTADASRPCRRSDGPGAAGVRRHRPDRDAARRAQALTGRGASRALRAALPDLPRALSRARGSHA